MAAAEEALSEMSRKEESCETQSQSTNRPPQGLGKLIALWTAVGLALMLVWLDEGIISTILTSITDDFHSLDDFGWYASAYLFALCAFQLPFGKIYKHFPVKSAFLACLMVFEIGSIVQASARSSVVFIIGRTIAGIGGAGLITGGLVIFAEAFPKRWLGFTMGSVGVIYGIGIVSGPIIGGAIAKSRLGWRWCFWINPIAGVVTVPPLLVTYKPKPPERCKQSLFARLKDIDWVGSALFAAIAISFLLALQFGSSTYTWQDARTIALFVLAGCLAPIFAVLQWMRGERSMVPVRILKMRTVFCAMQYTFFLDGGYFILQYFLPLWFQVVQGVSTVGSAIHLLPLICACVFGIFVTGFVVGRTEYYWPPMLFGPVLLSTGAGLLTTLHPPSSAGQWVGYQVIAGLGMGSGTQLPLIATQSRLELADVSTGLSMILTCGYLGSSISVTVGQVIFSSRLETLLAQVFPGLDVQMVFRTIGATQLASFVPADRRQDAIQIYSVATISVFYLSAALAAFAVAGAVLIPWTRMEAKEGD